MLDVFKPVPWTERDDREARIALWVAAIAAPFFVAWLVGPKLLQDEWWKPARAQVAQLGYHWAAINVQEIPCHSWLSFDYGYSVEYQRYKGETFRRGYLCRKFGDDKWTWHPQ